MSEQKYHGENKLPFDDIDDVPLYKAIMLSLICIVLVPCVWLGISLLFDILCRLQANQFLLLTPLCCVVSGEAANTNIICLWVWFIPSQKVCQYVLFMVQNQDRLKF